MANREESIYRSERSERTEVGGWHWNLATDQISWSSGMHKIFGIAPDTFDGSIGMAMAHIHPEDRQIVVEQGRRALASDVAPPVEYRALLPDGSTRFVRAQCDAHVDASGNLIGIFGIIQSLAEARETDRQGESEAFSHALLEAIPDMMFRMTSDGTYIDFIPAKNLAPLMPPEQFIGRRMKDVLPPEVADPAMLYLRRALETGQAQRMEYDLEENGSLHRYEARMVADGPDAVVAIVRDVTESRPAAERADTYFDALEAAREALEEASPYLPRDSRADRRAARALNTVYRVIRGE